MSSEFEVKQARIHHLLQERGLAGVLLGRASSWSWATCGAEANVATNAERAAASLLFTRDGAWLLADRIEMPRLLAEEVGGLAIEPVTLPWHDPDALAAAVAARVPGPVGADVAVPGLALVPGALAALRQQLLPEEAARFVDLGRRTGEAIEAAARQVTAGQSEQGIAALLADETWRRGAVPVVILVAVDARIARFRHPTPGPTRLERLAMLVLCARRHGLIASATRLVHLGPLPAALEARAQACARVDAVAATATRPGATLGAVLERVVRAYVREGFPEAWEEHHQGGLAGYENREVVATPGCAVPVGIGQAYAWNPSIAGVKSEDTLLVGPDGPAYLTATGAWPVWEVDGGEGTLPRPAILER